MDRLADIKSRVIQKSGNQSGLSTGKMKIPGMKIGTQIAPGAPSWEDILWLAEKVEKLKDFMRGCGYSNIPDRDGAWKLIREVEGGK